jgi:CRP-like cAMP-binding protein
MDFAIGSLSAVQAALLPREWVLGLADRFPRLARALRWSTLVEESITREWLLNVGHRTAVERIAHFFCEVFARLHSVGLTRESSCELPLTQSDIGEALALSAVHVNRVIMDLRQNSLITFRNQQLTLHDMERLRAMAGFDARYLHLDAIAGAS